jgi:16S rRNA A1518/A1519 N6-dimethyltransferase RsmA/KsgA/DIM1 with predicted DNA glycosylase/AP lyase activity
MWKEAVVIFFGARSRDLPTVIEETKNPFSQYSVSLGQVINPRLREYQAVVANSPLQISFPLVVRFFSDF